MGDKITPTQSACSCQSAASSIASPKKILSLFSNLPIEVAPLKYILLFIPSLIASLQILEWIYRLTKTYLGILVGDFSPI